MSGRLLWRTVTVREVVPETARARTLVLDVDDWPRHVPGQHVDLRLTAEDGYQAQRSYSIASAPEDEALELTIDLVDDGEVSPYLVEEVRPGDQFEVRGPIGGHFTWDATRGGPLLLVGGGSGVVPLMSMLRHLRARGGGIDARLLLSARTAGDVLYADELDRLSGDGIAQVHLTLTRGTPAGWTGFARRVDDDMLRAVGPGPDAARHVFVCGPTGFVEHAIEALLRLGHPPQRIRAERFGPTGGATP